ncbi:hypothetical protein GQ457_01G028510 [Hibiscus cannabinus]
MENQFLHEVEGNLGVRRWSTETQRLKGDSVLEGEKTEQWDFTRIKVVQNHLPELKMIWERWDGDNKQMFFKKYGDLPYLLDISIDKVLLRALAQFWNPAYNCFTFGSVDLFTSLPKKTFEDNRKDEQWIAPKIKTKGGTQCIAWKFIQELIQAQHEPVKQVDLLALSIYGLVIFPKSLGYIDDAVVELFSSLHAGVNPVPAMLAETFRSLTACKKAGEGRFIGCAQLLLVGSIAISGSLRKQLTEHASRIIHHYKIWHQHRDKRISRTRNGCLSFKISKKKMLFGRRAGSFQKTSFIDAKALTGSRCWEYGEHLAMFRY